jgi:hypothetical protein
VTRYIVDLDNDTIQTYDDKTLHTYFMCPECGKIDRASKHCCTKEEQEEYQKQRLEHALDELDAARTELQRMTEWRDGWKKTAKRLWRHSQAFSILLEKCLKESEYE